MFPLDNDSGAVALCFVIFTGNLFCHLHQELTEPITPLHRLLCGAPFTFLKALALNFVSAHHNWKLARVLIIRYGQHVLLENLMKFQASAPELVDLVEINNEEPDPGNRLR